MKGEELAALARRGLEIARVVRDPRVAATWVQVADGRLPPTAVLSVLEQVAAEHQGRKP